MKHSPRHTFVSNEEDAKNFVNYIKTCTGFTGDVELDAVDIINKHKNDLVEIKASGGIKSREDMIKLIRPLIIDSLKKIVFIT